MQITSIPVVRVSLTKPLIMESVIKLTEGFNRYGGDVIQLKTEVPVNIFCFRKPEHIKQVYAHKTMGIVKPPNLIKKADWLMGNGTFNDLGSDWKRKKAVSGPNFERKSSEIFCQNVSSFATRLFPRWDTYAAEGRIVDIYYEMRRLVVDLSFSTFFSEVLGERLDQVCEDTHFAESMFTTQSPLWLPLPSNLRFRKVGRRFHKLMHGIFAKHLREDGPTDILSSIINTVDPQLGRHWTNQEVVDEAFSIYFGASAMSSALTWTLYLLSQHPRVMEKLKNELDSVMQGKNPTVADLHKLPYLDMVLDETSRLYPPFWGSLRYSREPVEIAGHTFPKKSMFVALRYFAQRHPDYWKNPEAFDPERFAKGNREHYHPVAFLPFGAGPRTCLGQHMTPIICKSVIATLMSRYTLEFRGRFPNDPLVDFTFGVYPKDKIMMLINLD